MATVNVVLSRYISKKGQQIVIRVEHAGRQRLIDVGWRIQKSFWINSRVSSKYPDSSIINAAIASKEAEIKRYLADCQLHGKPIHLDLIGTGRTSYSFTDYLRHRATQYKAAGKIIMNRKVNRFVVELLATAGREVFFEDITGDFLRLLDQHMIDNENVENTRHKKFKFLGEFYTHAMDEGKAPAPNPFKKYKIVTKPVKKEKLSPQEMKAIEDLVLRPGPVAHARNMFLFSFYCKGQRFENCIMLRREHIRNGRIYFRTNKGNDHISIKIHSRLQAILDLYLAGEYIFPYVEQEPQDPEEYLKLVDSRNVVVNRNLKVVAEAAGITKHLTFHIARHTFADQFMKTVKNVSVVQETLGHADQRTTRMYINSLGDEILDPEMEKLYGE